MSKRAAYCLLLTLLLLSTNVSLCRRRNKGRAAAIAKAESRIIGEEAPRGRFPYMCSLRERGTFEHRCGATLIYSQWAITAAHCVDPELTGTVGLAPVVYCGIYEVNDHDPELTFNAVAYMHELWKGVPRKGYDIAVLKLDRETKAPVPALDISGNPLHSGSVLAAIGWGRTRTETTAETLQITTNLFYVGYKSCDQLWSGIIKKEGMICAGIGQEDTCKGDSGGPLFVPAAPNGDLSEGNPSFDLIVGITSYGVGSCDGSMPGVYTSVGFFSEWIQSIVNGDERPSEDVAATISNSPSTDEESTTEKLEKPERKKRNATRPAREEYDFEEAFGSDFEDLSENERTEAAVTIIKDDNSVALKFVLSEGLSPTSRYNDTAYEYGNLDDTLLHWCARFGSVACAKVLLNKGVDVDVKNLADETPLMTASFNGQTSVAKILINKGADVNAANNYTLTALHGAAQRGQDSMIELLLSSGAEVDAKGSDETTPLHNAAGLGHTTAAKILLANGASVDETGPFSMTALHFACFNGSEELLKGLLENDADVDARNVNGDTPVHTSAISGNAAAAEVLLEYGADVDARQMEGATPLHYSAVNGTLNVARVLVRSGATLFARNDYDQTPVMLACAYQQLQIAEFIWDVDSDRRLGYGVRPTCLQP